MRAVTAPIKADMEMNGTEAETATIARAARQRYREKPEGF